MRSARRNLGLSKLRFMTLTIGFSVCSFVTPVNAQEVVQQTAQESAESFQTCLLALGERARQQGIDAALVASVLENTTRLERVVKLDRNQPEFTTSFAGYYSKRVTESRVSKGRLLMIEHQELLTRMQQEYGVPAQYLLAFWGLETNYGAYFGKIQTTDALATLACDQRRSKFFSAEFINALSILHAGDIEQPKMLGSWAGAIGNMQFLPSVFLKYAVDGDGDGRRDLWGSIPDSMASAANFLRGIGWQDNLRWGREVILPTNFDYSLSGSHETRKLADWVQLGVTDAYGGAMPALDIEAAILVPSGHRGPAFLIYDNFKVIMRWNRSEYYAVAVGRLADRIAGSAALTRKLESNSEPVTRDLVKQLQTELASQGYAVGKADGVFGPATRRALSQFQKSNKMIADGHLNSKALRAVLRSDSATGLDQ